MKKTRIVKRTSVDGKRTTYVIQQRHFIFRWWWVDAWVNSSDPFIECEYSSYQEAVDNMCFFDGSKVKEEVMDRSTVGKYEFSFNKKNPHAFEIRTGGKLQHVICMPPVEKSCDVLRLSKNPDHKYEFNTDSIVFVRRGRTASAYLNGDLIAHTNG